MSHIQIIFKIFLSVSSLYIFSFENESVARVGINKSRKVSYSKGR